LGLSNPFWTIIWGRGEMDLVGSETVGVSPTRNTEATTG